jgi:hypothetical protein
MVGKSLVIDISVASAATERITLDLTSKNCCDFLKAILDCEHHFVMTPDIKDEWDRHQSIFARKWRLKMLGMKRVAILPVEANQKLRARLDAIAKTDNERAAMLKDCLLIEAAIASDKTVISRDERARIPFKQAAIAGIRELQNIVWVNPDKPEETPIEWLKSGANPESERLLGFISKG